MSKTVYDFSVKDIEGKDKSLSEYKGKALLIVNVASQCGFTPQYKGLEEIHKEYQGKLEVLGFPCNQFGKQEPGNAEEIKNFCSLNYDVSFPLFAKIEVNGDNASPLYQFLKSEKKGFLGTGMIKWNFTKFLVDKQGKVVKRFAPSTGADSLKAEIEQVI